MKGQKEESGTREDALSAMTAVTPSADNAMHRYVRSHTGLGYLMEG